LDIRFATLDNCSTVTGIVVVIDVWRSLTTAAFSFDAGVREIIPVDSAKEAMALRGRFSGALLMGRGELGGPPADGFDYGNSPSALMQKDLRDQRIIQFTPNGTRGIVRSGNAKTLMSSSFVCAGATVRYIKQRLPAQVTFVITDEKGEDQACGEYLAALLRDETPDATVLDRIHDNALQDFRTFVSKGIWTKAKGAVLEADLDCCLSLDRFDFAMVVQRRNGTLVMEAVA
jgi:2-phosphosulfolactate phosphatase